MKNGKAWIIAIMLSGIALTGAMGSALAQVAGTAATTVSISVEEMRTVAAGWSAKKHLLGKAVYNDNNDKIGEVEDIIITPDKHVSYFIVGVGGFLGLGAHNVAVPAEHFQQQGDKIVLPGATKEVLTNAPKFEYAK